MDADFLIFGGVIVGLVVRRSSSIRRVNSRKGRNYLGTPVLDYLPSV